MDNINTTSLKDFYANTQKAMETFRFLEESDHKIMYPSTISKADYHLSQSLHKDGQVSGINLDTLRNAGIVIERITNKPSTLVPSIDRFDEDKVLKFIDTPHKEGCSISPCTCVHPIVISRDQTIVDGHHRWLAAYNMGDKSVLCDQINLPFSQILKILDGQDKRPTEVNDPSTPKTTTADPGSDGLSESEVKTILKFILEGLKSGVSEDEVARFVSEDSGIAFESVNAVLTEAIQITTEKSRPKRNFKRPVRVVTHGAQTRRKYREVDGGEIFEHDNWVKSNFRSEQGELSRVAQHYGTKANSLYKAYSTGKPTDLEPHHITSMQNTDAGDIHSHRDLMHHFARPGLDFGDNRHSTIQHIFNILKKKGPMEMPIVMRHKDGTHELVGGNTRLSTLHSLGIKPKAWVFNAPSEIHGYKGHVNEEKTKTLDEVEWVHPFKTLKKIARSSSPDKVIFKDGKSARIDVKSAHAIVHIHKNLSEPNQKKIENACQKNSRSFKKIRDWAFAHTSALREDENMDMIFEAAIQKKSKIKSKTNATEKNAKRDHISGGYQSGKDGKPQLSDEDEMDVDGGGAGKAVSVNPGLSGDGTYTPTV